MPYREHLGEVKPYRPQAPLERLRDELGLERVVKLASNEGAFGPLPAALAAIDRCKGDLHRYPDGSGIALREALAAAHGVKADRIVLGNGADELIRLAGLVALEAGDRGVMPWPSFPTYVAACHCLAAEAHRVPLGDGWAVDLDALLASVNDRTRIVFIANPNNPTGRLIPSRDLRGFIDALPPKVLVVLDEAYAEFAAGDDEPEGVRLVREGRERLIVLRTFSKVHGLAGLRVGYAVATREAAAVLDRVRNIFNVNRAAHDAALASLGEGAEIARRVAHAQGARTQIAKWLALAGHHPVASHANFVFAVAAGGHGVALADALLRQGVAIRALDGFGVPEAVRVTVGADEENEFFAAALDRLATGSSR